MQRVYANVNPESLDNLRVEPISDMTFSDLVNQFIDIINTGLIPVLVAIILAIIIWKVVDMFIWRSGDEQVRSDGRRMILIGVLVMAVIMTIWGILEFLRQGVFGG